MNAITENTNKLHTILDEREFQKANERVSAQNKLSAVISLEDFKESVKGIMKGSMKDL